MVCLTLADFVLEKFGGDSMAEVEDNLARFRERSVQEPGPARPARRKSE
jgi:hypothetical protein